MKNPDKRKKKLSRRIFSVQGEEIKRKRTLRFWFSSIIWVLFAITGATTAIIFSVLKSIPSLVHFTKW